MVWGEIFFWPLMGALVLVRVLFAIVFLAFIIWMIVDCSKRKFKVESEKIVWIALLVILSLVDLGIGFLIAIVYYIFVRALNPRGVSKNDSKRK